LRATSRKGERAPRRRARSAQQPEHDARERWVVSYADFITLLFAFFVVMYAISSLNEGQYRVLSDALLHAFRHERVVTAQTAGIAPLNTTRPAPPLRPVVRSIDTVRKAQEQKLLAVASRLQDALKPLVQTGAVRLTRLPHGIAVEINASVLFAPAQAALQDDSIAALVAVARVLNETDNVVKVEGHTDNLPIASAQYPSNWELSSARASSVARLFVANGVVATRLTATGYAENRPVESNDTPEGRARNRRVTLLILEDGAAPSES
jgi:chemotaxis protein MotB